MEQPLTAFLIIAILVSGGVSAFAGYQLSQRTVADQQPAIPDLQTKNPSFGVGDNVWQSHTIPLPALDGEKYALDHWKGKVILLNFWASWCAPCQYEIPELIELQRKHEAAGLQIIGIGVDKERPLRNVSRSLGINYPVLVADDTRGPKMLEYWGNSGQIVPYNVVIGRDGRINYTHLGLVDQEVFDEYVAPLLNTP